MSGFAWGTRYAGEFFAGWLTEYSLSIDNLFVFVIIMSRFAVPRQYQQTVLLVGIVLALIFRGLFIAAGAAAISSFARSLSVRRIPGLDRDRGWPGTARTTRGNYKENALIRTARRLVPLTRGITTA